MTVFDLIDEIVEAERVHAVAWARVAALRPLDFGPDAQSARAVYELARASAEEAWERLERSRHDGK